jgi:hypothetical protein
MARRIGNYQLAWLITGLIGGVLLAGIWPTQPTFATATDRLEQFGIATGFTDEGLEGVYILDFMTGQLQALVIHRQLQKFAARYVRNVSGDFGVEAERNPQYVMVTGRADLRQVAGRGQYTSQGVLYVAELESGQICVYTFPFGGDQLQKVESLPFVLLDKYQFRPRNAIRRP